MVAVNDCYDTCQFTNEPDGKLHLRLAPGGGLSCESDGLHAAAPVSGADGNYVKHDERYYGNYDLSAFGIASGYSNQGPGPVTPPVDVCVPISNPYPDEMIIEMSVKVDLAMIGIGTGAGAGSGAFSATISPDGVFSYEVAQFTQYYALGGFGEGYNSCSNIVYWTVPAGWSGTPRCVLVLANYGGANPKFIKSTLIECRIHTHRH